MSTAGIALLPVTQAAAADITAGRRPSAHDVPADYPTEFSLGIADSLGAARGVGPFFIAREGDDMVVGDPAGGGVTRRRLSLPSRKWHGTTRKRRACGRTHRSTGRQAGAWCRRRG